MTILTRQEIVFVLLCLCSFVSATDKNMLLLCFDFSGLLWDLGDKTRAAVGKKRLGAREAGVVAVRY